jgi:peptidoglycan/xylan/chitin deacetylase (PgdA/CDA1 family)
MFISPTRSLIGAARRIRKGGIIVNEHTLSRSQTRFHVEILSRSFDFIHHDELFDRLNKPRARPFCLLTFDDGKRSNATEVAPELGRLGVPAVFYVVTRCISDGTPNLFDSYKVLTDTLGHAPQGLEPDIVKLLPYELFSERLERACTKHRVAPDMTDDNVRSMSWDEVRHLSSRGFTIGAHTLRHVILTCEQDSVALEELEKSMAEVTTELRSPCATFAFTNGNYNARLAKHAVKCGAKTVMTTEPLWADSRSSSWRLPRIQLFEGQSTSKIELKIALAAAGKVLADPNGDGRLYQRINRLNRQQNQVQARQTEN